MEIQDRIEVIVRAIIVIILSSVRISIAYNIRTTITYLSILNIYQRRIVIRNVIDYLYIRHFTKKRYLKSFEISLTTIRTLSHVQIRRLKD